MSTANQTGVQMCTPMSLPTMSHVWDVWENYNYYNTKIWNGITRCHSLKGQNRYVYPVRFLNSLPFLLKSSWGQPPEIRFPNSSPYSFGRPPHFFSCQPTFPYLKTCTGTQISKQNHCKQLTLILISFLKCSSRFLAHCLRQRFKTLLNGFHLIFEEFCLFVILYQP